jgi:hypothetical protein
LLILFFYRRVRAVNNSTNRGRQIVDELAARGIIIKTSRGVVEEAPPPTRTLKPSSPPPRPPASPAAPRHCAPSSEGSGGGPLSCFYRKNTGSQALSAPDAERAAEGFTSPSEP